jgi:hypothetical protein
MAQMLEEARVALHEIGHERLAERVVQRNELDERVVVHLSHRRDAREVRA